MINGQKLERFLDSLIFTEQDRQVRLLSVLSAVIAVCDNDLSRATLLYLKRGGLEREVIYETILQSYLFLGFPRMIEAALVFKEIFGNTQGNNDIERISPEEAEAWFENGMNLCQRVYSENFDMLQKKFKAVSPEIFRWMVIEGYGKVLSRPGLTLVERELAEVAALIIEKRERQLTSHVLGSLNVGAEMNLIKQVNEDIKPLATVGAYELAVKVIQKVEDKYEAPK